MIQGGSLNILGNDSIGHCEDKKSSYEDVFNFDGLPTLIQFSSIQFISCSVDPKRVVTHRM